MASNYDRIFEFMLGKVRSMKTTTFQMCLPFLPPSIMVMDPKNVEHYLVKNFYNYEKVIEHVPTPVLRCRKTTWASQLFCFPLFVCRGPFLTRIWPSCLATVSSTPTARSGGSNARPRLKSSPVREIRRDENEAESV
jgi:hypothetical protein